MNGYMKHVSHVATRFVFVFLCVICTLVEAPLVDHGDAEMHWRSVNKCFERPFNLSFYVPKKVGLRLVPLVLHSQ